MEVDEKEFFREATVRVCGSLEIERALWRCFVYIRDFVPATEVYLNYYDRSLGAIRFYATANEEGGRRLNLHVPLPPETRALIEQTWGSDILLVEHAEDHPITKAVRRTLDVPDFATILMPLELEGTLVGVVAFPAVGKNPYGPVHLRLLSLLMEPFAIAFSNSLRYQQLLDLQELLADDNRYLRDELLRAAGGEEIVGSDLGLKGVMEMVRTVAPLASPVLLLGETGVGKEVVANAIHQLSPRKDGPFIKVNCGAIPGGLLDSELFGHEKGAFTGALAMKRGRFERARGGTIFLDEVGELSLDAQVRFLRVLQEKEIERIGSTTSIKVNIRVVAATHRNLEAMVAERTLRSDLYYRLKVFPISIPPLREHKADIPALVHHFMKKKSRAFGFPYIPVPAPGAMDLLMVHDWPGNVRELENAVERALILSKEQTVSFEDLNVPVKGEAHARTHDAPADTVSLDEAMSLHIKKVLKLTGGRVDGDRGAARILGINPATLRHRMRKLSIPFGRKA
ncbi:MAG: sigma 54-interacting transcriptional regulator [Syntrophobacteraceae bacterium]